MTEPVVVPCASKVKLSITGDLAHLCPHVDEVDNGTVEITWTTDDGTLELHSVRAWLDGFADRVIAHEELTEELQMALDAIPGICDARVTTHWTTAGFAVTATGAW